MQIAAVRNATVAGHNEAANCAPFASGKFLLSLNGYLQDFDSVWLPLLRDMVSAERQAKIVGSTDSEWILQAILTRFDDDPDLALAVQGVTRDLVGLATSNNLVAQLNLLVSDGKHLIGTRAGTESRTNSLYLLRDGDEMPAGLVLASEPLMDDPGWEPVEPHSLVVLQAEAPPVRLTI